MGPMAWPSFPRYELLKAVLDRFIDETLIGLVQYGAAHLTNRFNALEFITTKQKRYEPECEVRAILTCVNPLDGCNRHIDFNNIPHSRPLPMNPRHPWVPECKRRRIVMKELVQEVVISPWAEPDNIEEIELWNQRRGLSEPLRSELRDGKTPTLDEYRKHMGIAEPPPEPERVATTHELDQFYQELSTLTPERVRFLYRQHLGEKPFGSKKPSKHFGCSIPRNHPEGSEDDGKAKMTPEERRKRPEHHVVHDYANLVSSCGFASLTT